MRFPEFSGEWEKCKIQDYGKVITGSTPTTSNEKYYINGSYLWASPADLGMGKEINDTKTKLSLLGFKKTRVIPQGSILVTCIGSTIGKIGMAVETMSSNQQINSIVVNAENNNDFVYYSISHAFPRYLSEVGVQTVPILSKSNFEKLPNYTTSYEEQEKIGYFLNLLDERIQTQKKIIDKYESLIKGLSNKLLYSKNGVLTYLYDILIERKERTEKNNQYKVLSSTINGILSQREYFSKDIASDNNIGYKVIHLYDIVLSPQNLWMGNINYNEKFNIGIVSPSYKIYIINEKYDKRFIANLLKTHRSLYKYKIISEQGASIVRRNLDIKAFEKLSFEIPAFEEQNKIGNIFDTVKQRLTLSYSMQSLYKQQKQWLLNHLFI